MIGDGSFESLKGGGFAKEMIWASMSVILEECVKAKGNCVNDGSRGSFLCQELKLDLRSP